jgi:hypothetical protein
VLNAKALYNVRTRKSIGGERSDLRVDDIDHGYEDATVRVTITTFRPGGRACTQTVTPFKETIRRIRQRLRGKERA